MDSLATLQENLAAVVAEIAELTAKRSELEKTIALFMCPYSVGDRILHEYEPGKFTHMRIKTISYSPTSWGYWMSCYGINPDGSEMRKKTGEVLQIVTDFMQQDLLKIRKYRQSVGHV